ncbi:MAG: hypothetical protein M3Q22_16230 [Actinomycetota bacterium]|nr:hypothetical protein [Actinomycetota bacterium]
MPKTAPLSREQIEAQAADLAAQVAAFQAEDQRRADEEWRRRAAAQHQWDERFAASVSRRQLDADVDQARAALNAALEADPLVQALAGYLAALRRRSHLILEHNSALVRLGQPENRRPSGMATEVTATEVAELIAQAMTRVATERVGAEMAELHAQREAAGTDTTEENR